MPTILLAGLLLSGCAQKTEVVAAPAFPEMTVEQVEAMIQARQAYPVLDEWWIRFNKAWCKVVNDPCQ